MLIGHQQMVVGRGYMYVGAIDRLAINGMRCLDFSQLTEKRWQHAARRADMQNHENGAVKILRQTGNNRPERLDTAMGCADRDDTWHKVSFDRHSATVR